MTVLKRGPDLDASGGPVVRSVVVKPTFTAVEAAAVKAAAADAGWAVGGWVGAVVEAGLGIGGELVTGSGRVSAWGVLRESAGRLVACLDNADELVGGGVLGSGAGSAGRIRAWAGMQVLVVRGVDQDWLVGSARVGVAAVEGLVPGSRAVAGRRRRRAGKGLRVDVGFSPEAGELIRGMTAAGGWAAADWVGAVGAFTAARMLAARGLGESGAVLEMAGRMDRAGSVLHELVLGFDDRRVSASELEGGISVAQAQAREVEDAMAGLLAERGRLEAAPVGESGPEAGSGEEVGDIFVSLDWLVSLGVGGLL